MQLKTGVMGSARRPPSNRTTFRFRRFTGIALMVVLLGVADVAHVAAQDASIAPWVLVVPAANQTGNSALDPVGGTVADTIELTLRLLGDFEVRELPPERIPEGVIRGDPAALQAFSQQETMDYIVFGALDQIGDADRASFAITASVWERASQSITVSERETAESIFGTFDASDALATSFIATFSGQRIAFGSLRLQNTGWPEGSYRVLIDGSQVAIDQPRIDSVLIGEREIAVVANNGADPGAVVLDERIQIAEGAVATLTFDIQPPPPVTEAAPDPEPEEKPMEEPVEEPEAVAESEPEGEPQQEPADEPERAPQIEAGPQPWSRNTRTVAGRRPIVSYGGAIKSLYQPANGDWFSGGQLNLGIDFGGGWYLGFDVGNSASTGIIDGDILVDTQQVRNDIANGAEIDLRLVDLLGVRASVGYRLGEWQWGPVRVDLTPVGRAGLDAWGPSFYSGDVWFWQLETADGISDFLFPQGMLGLGIMSRVHLWRFSLVGQLYADYNVPLGPDRIQEGDDLYLSEDPTTAITTLSSIDPGLSPGFSLGGSLGLALSTGGRAPDPSGERGWSRRERRERGRWPVVAVRARGTGGTLGQGTSGIGFELGADIDFARRMYAGFSAGALFASIADRPELMQESVLADPNFWNDPAIRIDAEPAGEFRFVGSVGYAFVSYPLANSSFDVIGLGRFGFSRTQTAFVLSSSRGEELIPTDYSPDQFDYDRAITGVGVLGRWHRGRVSVHLGMHLDAATLTDSSFTLQGEELVVLPDADAGGEFATGRTIPSGSVDRTVVTFTGFAGVALSFGGWPTR